MTDNQVEHIARKLAEEFNYGFVFKWDRLTSDPGKEEMYDRGYWRHLARVVLREAESHA